MHWSIQARLYTWRTNRKGFHTGWLCPAVKHDDFSSSLALVCNTQSFRNRKPVWPNEIDENLLLGSCIRPFNIYDQLYSARTLSIYFHLDWTPMFMMSQSLDPAPDKFYSIDVIRVTRLAPQSPQKQTNKRAIQETNHRNNNANKQTKPKHPKHTHTHTHTHTREVVRLHNFSKSSFQWKSLCERKPSL